METQQDFKELLALFNDHRVEFLVVGAHALAFHGAPRFTGDIDLFLHPTHENAERVLLALSDFGFGSVGLTVDDFSTPDRIVQLGYPPVRVDLLTQISGVSWDQAAAGRQAGQYGEVPVYYLGRSDFVTNKRAAGRIKDLADVEALGDTETT